MASDRLFAEKKDPVGNFAFDRDTALVFDDMLNRSVPFYTETQRMIGEIAQKREALENVLILYQLWENEELLQRAGFRSVDVFFKWYNFCGNAGSEVMPSLGSPTPLPIPSASQSRPTPVFRREMIRLGHFFLATGTT